MKILKVKQKIKKMRRLTNLFDKIVTIENLNLADKKARKHKTKSTGVLKHDKHREENILKLYNQLKEGTYKTSEYKIFKIYEPKEREIYRLPYYPDRIVHHAIMNIMEPIWVSIFTTDTYSCIKNRGIHSIVRKLRRELKMFKNDTKYCLKLDIKKFYPSINHDILKSIIRKKIKDEKLLFLLDEIIDSANGVPIGNYLSQFFANLYLAYFDHWLKEKKKVKFYYRYADDIVILHSDKQFLHDLFKDIVKYLETLKLTIESNWQIFPVEARGIDFVGYVFRHKYIALRKSTKKRFAKFASKLNKKTITYKDYKNKMSSYWGWIKHCNSHFLKCKLHKPKEIIKNYDSILQ